MHVPGRSFLLLKAFWVTRHSSIVQRVSLQAWVHAITHFKVFSSDIFSLDIIFNNFSFFSVKVKSFMYFSPTICIFHSSTENIQTVARVVFGEARGEPMEGQLAVAYTIVNRVNHEGYPNTLKRVVFQKNRRRYLSVQHFKWVYPRKGLDRR